MKQKAALPELPLPLRQAFVIVLAATLATGAFAAPAPETDPVVKRAAPGESPRLSIAHDPLKCLSTEARPLVDARVMPGQDLDRAARLGRAPRSKTQRHLRLGRLVDDNQIGPHGPVPHNLGRMLHTAGP